MTTDRDEWLTPPALLAALGSFDLDPCAPVARPWPTAAHHYTIADSGLIKPWFGRVWMNPPFRLNIAGWFARMAAHGRGIALSWNKTETRWFVEYIWRRAAGLLFVADRVTFYAPGGAKAPHHHGWRGIVLAAYGLEDFDRLAESGIQGALVPLAMRGQSVVVVRAAVASGTPAALARAAGATWRQLLRELAADHDGPITLTVAYAMVEQHPKARANRHWQAKVRQTLQGAAFRRVAPATYELAIAQ